jgi:translation initiation factor IF-2
VDYLKIKGLLEANPKHKMMMYTMSCAVNLGDRGKKEASKEVGEEKRKRKRLYVLRERKKSKISMKRSETTKKKL